MTELAAEKESSALKKLQVAAGFMDKPQVERLDWMYEQTGSLKPDNDKLMNMPIAAQKDKDLEDVKRLGEATAGSLFLQSATRTTEDMLRKLREDPLFQIKKQEQAARESMMANPLVVAKLKKKAEKAANKGRKRAKKAAKKAAKKEKKALKKAAKAEGTFKKKKKAESSSSDSDDSDSDSETLLAANAMARPVSPLRRQRSADRGAAGRDLEPLRRRRPASPQRKEEQPSVDMRSLGPSNVMVSKREEYAASLAERKQAALASRGAPRRMDEDEKRRRLEQMRADAERHDRNKDQRCAASELREKEIEELEKKMRNNSDQKYFRDMRHQAYMGDTSGTVADRLRNQRHRRQKNVNDPLERDN